MAVMSYSIRHTTWHILQARLNGLSLAVGSDILTGLSLAVVFGQAKWYSIRQTNWPVLQDNVRLNYLSLAVGSDILTGLSLAVVFWTG